MCYGIRAGQAEPEREGNSLPSSGLDRLRPRAAVAFAAVLLAGFATAALLAPSAPLPVTVEKTPAAPVPVMMEKVAVPAAGVVEQAATGLDDGVPTALNDTKRQAGECHHGL